MIFVFTSMENKKLNPVKVFKKLCRDVNVNARDSQEDDTDDVEFDDQDIQNFLNYYVMNGDELVQMFPFIHIRCYHKTYVYYTFSLKDWINFRYSNSSMKITYATDFTCFKEHFQSSMDALSTSYTMDTITNVLGEFVTVDKTKIEDISPDLPTYHIPQPQFNNEYITRFEQIPTLNQIVFNHANLTANLIVAKTMGHHCSIECEFHMLAVRTDGLAIVELNYIETQSIICAPPIHGLSGHSIKTINTGLQDVPFSTVMLIDLAAPYTELTIDQKGETRFDFKTHGLTHTRLYYIRDGLEHC